MMSSEIEIEFKNIVTKEEFHRILHKFSIQDCDFFNQENHYFDTPSFTLKRIGCALRIRKKNGHFQLTLKQPAPVGLLETNQSIDEERLNIMLTNGNLPDGEVQNRLKALNVNFDHIKYFGTLTTNRAEINYLDGLLVFDASFYLKKEDYEIEYEVKDRKLGEKNFLSLMDQLNIPIRKTENKIVRFYKEQMKQKQDLSEETANDVD